MAWRVLVADDDPEICTLIKTILRNASFEVEVCADAESALVHLQRDKAYDILISDFMLPGISGIELITQVRLNRATAALPIVMISGHNNYAMDSRARSAGANAFLNKPFTLSQLRTTVQSLLAGAPGRIRRARRAGPGGVLRHVFSRYGTDRRCLVELDPHARSNRLVDALRLGANAARRRQ